MFNPFAGSSNAANVSEKPYVPKGTLNSKDELPKYQEGAENNPKPGWIYYVKTEDPEQLEEYVFTEEHKWEKLGYVPIATINEVKIEGDLDSVNDLKIAGKIVAGQDFNIDEKNITANIGAEIFNDYANNKATGKYSHTEGTQTIASSNYSHAEGYNTIAGGYGSSHTEGSNTVTIGYASHAEGMGTTAKGEQSHAEGNNTKANGIASHAEGMGTTANGGNSHAEGNSTMANSSNSHAEGNNTMANGGNSHAEGESSNKASDYITITYSTSIDDIKNVWNNNKFSLAFNQDSHVEGKDCLALGKYSHAEGFQTIANSQASHAEGNNTIANGSDSHAEGKGTMANGSDSHAEGKGTEAWGSNSHAEGFSAVATGDNSHVEGSYSKTGDSNAHAEGNKTTAWGNSSHAEGNSTNQAYACITLNDSTTNNDIIKAWQRTHFSLALKDASHVEGEDCLALGNRSHAEGYGAIAASANQHAQGKYNIEDSASKYAFIIGNGTSYSARSNAFAIDWQGNIYVNNAATGVNVNDLSQRLAILESEPDITIDTQVNGSSTNPVRNSSIYNFVNSSVATNTAYFKGTFNTIEELKAVENPTNNDYGFLVETDDAGNTVYNRYKYNGTEWVFEYALNNSSFTINQWDSINSGITAEDVEKIKTPATINGVDVTGTLDSVGDLKIAGKIYYVDGVVKGEMFNGAKEASGEGSHAEGVITVASGNGAHAEGFFTTASGICSHSEGNYTTASGTFSHAEGATTTASGDNSHAEGSCTIAASDSQHAQGRYNIEDSDNKYAFIIGNGDVNTRSNAFAVDWNGKVYVNNAETGVDLSECVQNSDIPTVMADYGINSRTQIQEMETEIDKQAGKNVAGQEFVTDNPYVPVVAGDGAEIFNDYTNNVATGRYSHAGGFYTQATGDYSSAEGERTIAASRHQHVQGQYNVADYDDKYAFIIGNGYMNYTDNGYETIRSNAFAIDWRGNIYVRNSETGVNVNDLMPKSAIVKLNSMDEFSALTDKTADWYFIKEG